MCSSVLPGLWSTSFPTIFVSKIIKNNSKILNETAEVILTLCTYQVVRLFFGGHFWGVFSRKLVNDGCYQLSTSCLHCFEFFINFCLKFWVTSKILNCRKINVVSFENTDKFTKNIFTPDLIPRKICFKVLCVHYYEYWTIVKNGIRLWYSESVIDCNVSKIVIFTAQRELPAFCSKS